MKSFFDGKLQQAKLQEPFVLAIAEAEKKKFHSKKVNLIIDHQHNVSQ